MGYLFLFRPGMKSIAAWSPRGVHHPGRQGQGCDRHRSDLARSADRDDDLWLRRHRRDGDVGARHRAVDAVGKRAGAAAAPWLWGHYRSQILIYGSGRFRGAGGDGMIEKALHFAEQGYKAIKMQVRMSTSPAQDLDNVRRMREALGPDIDIMIDVNMGWSADLAIEMGRKFEKYDIYWLEEPVPADDFAGYQRIAAALDMRVVGGRDYFTRYDSAPFFLNPRLPILQPDLMRGGMRRPAQDRHTRRYRVASPSRRICFPNSNVHLLASIPNGIWCENMGADRRPLGRSARDQWRHDHGAGAAGSRSQVQGRGVEVQDRVGTGVRRGALLPERS